MKFAIGIDWGGTNLALGLVGEDGQVHTKIITPTSPLGNKAAFFENIANYIKKITPQDKNVLGIGVGAPGIIDNKKGFIHELPNIPGWAKVPFSKILKEKTNYPVYIDNDVNVITLAEYIYGAGKGSKNIICITLGTGVGGGLVINNRLYRGSSANAGEIGHYTLDKNGPLCSCGNRGCLEAFIGNKPIVEKAKKLLKKNRNSLLLALTKGKQEKITPKLIAKAAKKGDKVSREIWEYVGECLGTVVAGAINLLNPDKIIIGGGVAKAGKILFDSIKKSAGQKSLNIPYQKATIVPSELGDKAGIIGGATLVFKKIKRK